MKLATVILFFAGLFVSSGYQSDRGIRGGQRHLSRTCGEVVIVQGDRRRKTRRCRRKLRRELRRELSVVTMVVIDSDATDNSFDSDDSALTTVFIDGDMSCSRGFVKDKVDEAEEEIFKKFRERRALACLSPKRRRRRDRAEEVRGVPGASWSWDYLQIGNWRLARTCKLCSTSQFSVSSDTGFTTQIFRNDGTAHPGPRKDFNGFDVGADTGPTYSLSGDSVQFGNLAVQVRDWRIRQINSDHLSVTHENGNVSRIYRSDGTLHGMVNGFSGYAQPLGEPACAFLTASYLQIGDWRIGAMNAGHLSVSHKNGNTSVIYRGTDGTIHPGPRTDWNAWVIPKEEVIMGRKEGC